MPSLRILREIERLDPAMDHVRIVHLSACWDFPFDTTRALEFALYRTYCVPSISGLLERTGEFLQRPQKRYDDTDLIVSELMEWGYDSDRGKRALRRMNQIHGRFSIANDDYLYVLSTFVFEPIRWNARFGWRPLCEKEKRSYFLFWREVGRRMNIRNIPDSLDEFEGFNLEYERANFTFRESNQRIGAATRDLFLSWLPRIVRPIVRPAIYAMMDDPLLDAFGFPKPSRWFRRIVEGFVRLRGRLAGLLPSRRKPRLRTETPTRTYPYGYRIEDLGPTGGNTPSSTSA
jgi:hypothetical protein